MKVPYRDDRYGELSAAGNSSQIWRTCEDRGLGADSLIMELCTAGHTVICFVEYIRTDRAR
jgi:hypothetical protein